MSYDEFREAVKEAWEKDSDFDLDELIEQM
jgi:hypothetical protein